MRSSPVRVRAALAVAALAAVTLAAVARGQGAGARPVRPTLGADPYSRFEPALLRRLGYRSIGPFRLGANHGTDHVDADRGIGPLRWIETAHFRIGSGLRSRSLPPATSGRQALYAECRRLHELLPRVPRQPSQLDEWLQLHLFAQRLETLYAEFTTASGVDAQWFVDHPARGRTDGRGGGPFLGCSGKFVVLLFERQAQLARYLRRFCDCRADRPWRQYVEGLDAMLVATAADSERGRLRDPVQLHGHVIHQVVQNFIDAFVGSSVTTPLWWRQGLAYWHVRRIDERLCAAQVPVLAAPRQPRDWPNRLAARARHEAVPELRDVLHWHVTDGRSEFDHAVLWSLADYLMRRGDGAFGRWLRFVRQHPMKRRLMPRPPVLAWLEHALRGVYGLDIEALEQGWRRHLLKNYR